jgi:hypothetical protein
MSEDQNQVITELKSNIAKLIGCLEKVKEENKFLVAEKDALAQNLKDKDLEIKDLEVKFNTLKLAKTISATDDEKKDAKMKIAKMVREIDKCIALLNK